MTNDRACICGITVVADPNPDCPLHADAIAKDVKPDWFPVDPQELRFLTNEEATEVIRRAASTYRR
jgi:hypothetical protein